MRWKSWELWESGGWNWQNPKGKKLEIWNLQWCLRKGSHTQLHTFGFKGSLYPRYATAAYCLATRALKAVKVTVYIIKYIQIIYIDLIWGYVRPCQQIPMAELRVLLTTGQGQGMILCSLCTVARHSKLYEPLPLLSLWADWRNPAKRIDSYSKADTSFGLPLPRFVVQHEEVALQEETCWPVGHSKNSKFHPSQRRQKRSSFYLHIQVTLCWHPATKVRFGLHMPAFSARFWSHIFETMKWRKSRDFWWFSPHLHPC